EDGIRDRNVTGVQTCALPIYNLDDFATDCLATITEQKQKILDFLGLDHFRKVEVNLFDNQEIFLNFIKKLRWSKAKIPEYCRGRSEERRVGKEYSRKRSKDY